MPCSTPEQVTALCEGLASPEARTKYGSARQLVRLSEEDPGLLYPRFDFFTHLMEGDSRIFRWNASRILGHLARVDSEGRIDRLLNRFLAPIARQEMIGAANAIHGAADIALAKPHLADRIAREVLKVSRANYATPECRNIAAGHAIQTLDRFFPNIQKKKAVLAFVESQIENPRPATRKKAGKFLAKWNRTTIKP
jgi:hypothetical protein